MPPISEQCNSVGYGDVGHVYPLAARMCGNPDSEALGLVVASAGRKIELGISLPEYVQLLNNDPYDPVCASPLTFPPK
jgi:hypothetical protein